MKNIYLASSEKKKIRVSLGTSIKYILKTINHISRKFSHLLTLSFYLAFQLLYYVNNQETGSDTNAE